MSVESEEYESFKSYEGGRSKSFSGWYPGKFVGRDDPAVTTGRKSSVAAASEIVGSSAANNFFAGAMDTLDEYTPGVNVDEAVRASSKTAAAGNFGRENTSSRMINSSNTTSTEKKKKWYPGKFLGLEEKPLVRMKERREARRRSEEAASIRTSMGGTNVTTGERNSTMSGVAIADHGPNDYVLAGYLHRSNTQGGSGVGGLNYGDTSKSSTTNSNSSEAVTTLLAAEASATGADTDGGSMNRTSGSFSFFSTNQSSKKHTADEKDAEDVKKESMIARTVRGIRDKFIERKLLGKIYIHRLSGMISTAVTVDVAEGDSVSGVQDDFADLPYSDRRALSTIDAIFTSLESRSQAWDGVDFSGEVMLTRGATFGVSAPLLGVLGFSLTLEITASVSTLLQSFKKREALRLALKRQDEENERSSFSFFRSKSFSATTTKTSTKTAVNNEEDPNGGNGCRNGVVGEDELLQAIVLLSKNSSSSDNNNRNNNNRNNLPRRECMEQSNGWLVHTGDVLGDLHVDDHDEEEDEVADDGEQEEGKEKVVV